MAYYEFGDFIEQASEAELREALIRAQEVLTDDQRFYIMHSMEVRKVISSEAMPMLRQHVQTFEKRSRSGYFYREFDMGGDNYDWVPPHTEAWFFELGIWLDKACELYESGQVETAKYIFERCFPLIDDMTDGIVFAHELRDWMIHTQHDYQAVYANLSEQT